MAKRKINVPLAVALGVIVVVLAGLTVVFVWYKLPKDPKPYAEAAERYEVEGDWDKALENYKRAFSYSRNREDKTTWGLRVGDLLWVRGQELGPRDTSLDFYTRVLNFYRDSAQAQERLTRLWAFAASLHYSSEGYWRTLREQADSLIEMAPDRPYGYEAAGLACYSLKDTESKKKALEHFEKLRELDPTNPLGYFYPALIQSTQVDSPDPNAPKYDPEAANALMNSFPQEVTDAQRDRFRLYQLMFRRYRPPVPAAGASVQDRNKQRKEHFDAIAADLDQITDFSAMTRNEQASLADLAQSLGKRERAEEIYKGWTNDRAAILAELDNPPARPEIMANLEKENPVSLAGCAQLAELYLATSQPEEVEKAIERGLAQPEADRIDKGLIGQVQTRHRYLLEMTRCRVAMTRAYRVGQEVRDAKGQEARQAAVAAARQAWQGVEDRLDKVAEDYQRYVERRPDWHILYAQAALKLGEPGVAQAQGEKALELLNLDDPNLSDVNLFQEHVQATRTLAEAYGWMKQYGKALELVNRRMRASPRLRGRPELRQIHAQLLISLGEYPQAEKALDAMLAEPEMEAYWPWARQMKGTVLWESGRRAEAVDLWGEEEGQAGSAAQAYREGRLAMSQKREADARAKFREALAKDKTWWPAAALLAGLYMADKERPDAEKRAEAESALTSFLADNPDHQGAELMLTELRGGGQARATLSQTMAQEAETDVQRELRLAGEAAGKPDKATMARHLVEAEKLADPDAKPRVWKVGFELAVRIGDMAMARQYLGELERNDVDGVGGLSFRARLLLAERKYPEAIRALRDVLSARRSDSVTRRLLAQALLEGRQGTVKEAEDLLRLSLQENPLDPETWQTLVTLLYRTGRKQEAWAEAEKGLAVLKRNLYLENVRLEQLAATEPAKAIEVRLKIEQAHPDDWNNLQVLAKLYGAVKDQANCEAYALKVAAKAKDLKDPARLVVLAIAAEILRRNGSNEKGEKLLADYVRDNPDSVQGLLVMGKHLRQQGPTRSDDAEAMYKQAIAKSPTLPVYLAAADLYYESRRLPEAIAQTRLALAKAEGPQKAVVQGYLAKLLVESRQFDEADKAIKQFRSDWPGDANGDLLQGQLAMSRGQFDQAIEAFDRIIQAYPNAALAYFLKGQALYRLNPAANLSAAITNLRSALDRDPNLEDGRAAMLLANLYLEQDDLNQALTVYRGLLDRNPDKWEAWVKLIGVLDLERREADLDAALADAIKLYPDMNVLHALAGNVAMRRRRFAQAEGHYRQARKLTPKAEALALGLSQALTEQKKFQAIVDESPQWLRDVGETPSLYIAQAVAYKELRRKGEMLASLEKVCDLLIAWGKAGAPADLRREGAATIAAKLADGTTKPKDDRLSPVMTKPEVENWLSGLIARRPQDIFPRLIRAHYWGYTDQAIDAIVDLKKLAAERPPGPEASKEEIAAAIEVRLNLAVIYQQDGRFSDAAEFFDQVVTLSPDAPSPVALNNYAYLLANSLNDPAKAVPLAEKAAELTGHASASILDTLGWCYVRNGQAQRGLDVLEQARRREDLPIIYLHLALAHQALGHTDSAKAMARDAVKRAEDNPLHKGVKDEAAKLLNRLK